MAYRSYIETHIRPKWADWPLRKLTSKGSIHNPDCRSIPRSPRCCSRGSARRCLGKKRIESSCSTTKGAVTSRHVWERVEMSKALTGRGLHVKSTAFSPFVLFCLARINNLAHAVPHCLTSDQIEMRSLSEEMDPAIYFFGAVRQFGNRGIIWPLSNPDRALATFRSTAPNGVRPLH